MPETDDLVGKTLGERWSLRARLGAGGMGAVYLAHDLRGGPSAAVKVVKRELSDDADARARFAREAEALRLLDHPCIVHFFDTGESGELRWIAMELLEGRTLKSRLSSRGAIPWRESIPIVREVVRALQAAHAAGLIHRDLKPENIFLVDGPGATPTVKLLDFGVARHTQLPAGQTMTATGVVPGTPGFVAPEVVLKGPSNDPRSDYYGLGATWFEMLTGEKPFSAETPFALAMLHVTAEVPPPTSVRPGLLLPVRLEALLTSLLAKTPELRPPNAEALLAELDAIATEPDGPPRAVEPPSSLHNRFRPITNDATPHTRSLPVAAPGSNLLPHEATLTAGFTSLEHAAKRPAARRMRVALGAAVIAVLVVATFALGRLGRGTAETSTPPSPVGDEPPAPLVKELAPAVAPPPVPAPPAPLPTPPPKAPKGSPSTQHKPLILPIDEPTPSAPKE